MPVAVDGMVHRPRDLVIGDDDGCSASPYDQVSRVHAAAAAKHAAETKQMAAIEAGAHDASWVKPR